MEGSQLWKDALNRFDAGYSPDEPKEEVSLDPAILEIYEKVSLILSRYKSGKLPKAFKIIPNLNNWEQVLALTRPETWTPNATYQATKLFISAFNPKLAARFLSCVLLPKVRQDFSSAKQLNPHYYQAIKLAVFKPAAFFKGLVIPICARQGSTLREAAIIASILKILSIPALHAAAAVIKLSELPFSGPRAIILRTLVEKKYSMPQRALASVLDFFEKSASTQSNNTVLWQQLLLAFIQNYGHELSDSQKASVRHLISLFPHEHITEEIVNALDASQSMLA